MCIENIKLEKEWHPTFVENHFVVRDLTYYKVK